MTGPSSARRLAKTERIRHQLLVRCRRLGPGARLPTVRALVAALGVSSSTLDRVLDQLERQRVIVRHHGQGLYVAGDRNQATIALMTALDPLEPQESVYCQLIARALRRRLTAAGRRLRCYLTHDRDDSGLSARDDFKRDVAQGLVSGALLAATSYPEDLVWLVRQGTPAVALSDSPEAAHRFRIDYPALTAMGMERLAARGCRRVCLVAWDGGGPHFEDCARVAKRSARRLGLELPAWGVWRGHGGERHGETRKEFGARAAHELFGDRTVADRADGVVCTDDMIAAGLIPALDRSAIVVGKAVQVATHANRDSPVLEAFSGRIIPLTIDLDALVGEMLGRLDRLLAGETLAPETIFVAPVVTDQPL